MALRTPTEYLASLRDGRRIIHRGERVADVTEHPLLSRTIRHAAGVFAHPAEEPKGLWSYEDAGLGETVSTYFREPRAPEDLRLRARLIEETTRRGGGTLNIVKAVGTDAILGLSLVTARMDKELGTDYSARVREFRRRCATEDLAMALAATDPKGDRSASPSAQEDPDQYLRVVGRSPEGIVVRGAKVHTTASVAANELICIPCRALGPGDEDYAVAFAVPLNQPGLTLVCHPMSDRDVEEAPLSGRHLEVETLTIFEDVLVPWDRVFLCGETAYAGEVARAFANYHRFTAISYKPPMIDVLIGASQLLADAHGISRAGHVREKLARMIVYVALIRSARLAAAEGLRDPMTGLLTPEPVATNAGKFHFASGFHDVVRSVQDLAGGLVVTAPGTEDLDDPEVGGLVRKYMAGAAGWSGLDRWRLMQLVRDLTASDFGGYNLVVSLHGEGSMQAQLVQTLRDFDMEAATAAARSIFSEPIGTPPQPPLTSARR